MILSPPCTQGPEAHKIYLSKLYMWLQILSSNYLLVKINENLRVFGKLNVKISAP